MSIPSYSVLILMMLAESVLAQEDHDVLFGAARVDITPAEAIRLNGYLARGAPSPGVQQKLWAKALAIGSDEKEAAVLVSVDNLGVSAAIVDEVAARVRKRAGLARERLTFGSSHTHSAPCLTAVAPNIFGKPIPAEDQAEIDAYTRALTAKIEQVILAALATRQPGRLAWSQGTVGFAVNRRPPPGGPVDHSLLVLKATGKDGSVRAIVVNYGWPTRLKPGVEQLIIDAVHRCAGAGF